MRLAINDQIQNVKNLKLCLNCLKAEHLVKFSRAKRYNKCNVRHKALLHIDTTQKKELVVATAGVTSDNTESTVTQTSVKGSISNNMLLYTA